MALTEIDRRSGRPLRTDFRRRGAVGGTFGGEATKNKRAVARGLTRQWAVGPANYYHYYYHYYCIVFIINIIIIIIIIIII